jgi:hypothetical protein
MDSSDDYDDWLDRFFRNAQLEELWASFYAAMFWSPFGFFVAVLLGVLGFFVLDSITH